MKTSQNGINLIKQFEGCKLEAYKCPAGVWTIGYGHTGNVKNGDKISELSAETLLAIDLQKFEYAINENVVRKCYLTQNEFDSLVSFVYNIGISAFLNSTMLKLLIENKKEEAAEQFDKWIYAKGIKLAGLIKRRAAEKALFLAKPYY